LLAALQSDSTLTSLLAKVDSSILDPLHFAAHLRNGALAAGAYAANVGVGMCINANVNFGYGASLGVCLVADPHGREGYVLTLSANVPVLSGSKDVEPISGERFTLDAGLEALWSVDSTNGYQPLHLPVQDESRDDITGSSMCWNSTVTVAGGLANVDCWAPVDDAPFNLDKPLFTQQGNYSAYVGASTGGGFEMNFSPTYSLLVTCQHWTSVTGHDCPAANIDPPTISGSPTVGSTVTASEGTWSSVPNLSFSYQWQWCTSSDPSAGCTSIPNATSRSYLVTPTDAGHWLTVSVTATNSGGPVSTPASPALKVPT
jgi:hypothetical protein